MCLSLIAALHWQWWRYNRCTVLSIGALNNKHTKILIYHVQNKERAKIRHGLKELNCQICKKLKIRGSPFKIWKIWYRNCKASAYAPFPEICKPDVVYQLSNNTRKILFLTIKKFLCSLSYCFLTEIWKYVSRPLATTENWTNRAPLSLILYRNYTNVRFYKYKDFFL